MRSSLSLSILLYGVSEEAAPQKWRPAIYQRRAGAEKKEAVVAACS